jgi:hypothetical protein
VIPSTDTRAWSEAAGALRYLSIRLQGYVAELPDRSLPPRGRVQWSPAELGELGVLTRALALGEDDAGRAVASLDAIDALLHRGQGDAAATNTTITIDTATRPSPEVSMLGQYLAQRAIAMDSLPRLQRLGDPAQAPMRDGKPAPRAPSWQSLWARVVARVLQRGTR